MLDEAAAVERHWVDFEKERLAYYHIRATGEIPRTAVLMHGAGASDKERTVALGCEIAAAGHDVLALDFTGQGESSGVLKESSLQQRFRQVSFLIDALVRAGDQLILVGFSLSGQTVADLLVHYGGRIAAIGLCSPAIYTQAAWGVRFDSGFTELIRQENSWLESGALHAFRAFRGRSVLAVPAQDNVIPPEVTENIAAALANSRLTRLVFPRAGHQLGPYFRDNPADCGQFVSMLLS